MNCVAVGATNSDIAGLGIILAFVIQAFISLILSIFSYCLRDVWERAADDETDKRRLRKMRRHVDAVLASVSDTQTVSGIALLLSALVQRDTLELYHFHIIYDTVNFVGVSFCAAIVCSFAHPSERRASRILGIFLFSALYLAFVIIFGQKLSRWDWNTPGACYNPAKLAESGAAHPYVDKIYVAITCLYMFSMVLCCLVFFWDPPADARFGRLLVPLFRFYRQSIMTVAMLQYPLHMYSVFAIRASNEGLLTGESENGWGFGQIVALVMVGQILVACCHEYREYIREPKSVDEGAGPDEDSRE